MRWLSFWLGYHAAVNLLQTLWIAGVMLLTACAPGAPGDDLSEPAGDAREQLLEADYAFSALALEAGIEAAYGAYLADDAVQLPDGGLPLSGKDSIMANLIASAADTEFALSWEPVAAVVSAGGDLGYTWGNYFLESVDEDGRIFTAEGKYANVWRRNPGGWKVILDISNQNEAPYLDELDFDLLLDDEVDLPVD